MVFSSFIFIFGFLPIFLLLYFIVPRRAKNLVALLASYAFYFWGAPDIVLLLLASSVMDYLMVGWMQRTTAAMRRRLCAAAVAVNLGLLGYFKYTNFLLAQLSWFGAQMPEWVAVALPIGISFFTFQKVSYIVDVYRGETAPARNLVDYLLYVVLFPQLIAGPILRYHDVARQIRHRTHSSELFLYGCVRFSLGLAKKVLLANEMGAVADNVFSLSSEGLTGPYALLGAVAYSFQIYFDFAGYSDMAIGLCAMIGFLIPENFRMPYRAASMAEFWRRWHISLSQWMKEYLYIPLGGNRRGRFTTARNLWIVFLLSGLWHGASWTFVAWGAMHGLFLSLERLGLAKLLARAPRLVGVVYVWLVLLVSWVLFRAEDFSVAADFLRTLFTFADAANPPAVAAVIHERGRFVFLVCAALILLSLRESVANAWEGLTRYPLQRPVVMFALSYLGFIAAVLTLATTAFNPFIYFRF